MLTCVTDQRRAGPDFDELEPVYGSLSSRHSFQRSKSELDVAIIDDWTCNVSGLLDQLDHDLEQAKMSSGRIETSMTASKSAVEKVSTCSSVNNTLSSL